MIGFLIYRIWNRDDDCWMDNGSEKEAISLGEETTGLFPVASGFEGFAKANGFVYLGGWVGRICNNMT